MLLNPAALDPSIASYQDPQFGLNSPLLNPAIGRTPLYASLFNRFGPSIDPSSPYQPKDADKKRLFRQGLLAFAAASAKPNGGNFADSLASGLLAANGAMQDGTQQYANDAYRTDVMNRTRDEMAANTAKQAAYSHLYGDDGQLNPAGVREVQQADPQGYLALHDKLYPQETAWQPKEITFQGVPGTVLWNAKTGEMKTLDGQPFNAGGAQVAAAPQATPQAAPGGSALDDAVQQVESGGNPFAVSPKGALGPMQTMPGTLTDPGFGVTPARDNSPEEQRRVGIEYLHALTSKFGTQGGLAAYNWGPGHWQAALGQYGTPDAALAHAPAETRAYVPKVLARAGGVTSAIPSQTASGTIPASLPFGFAPKKPDKLSTVDQRKQDVAEMEASGIKVTPTMRNQYIMTGKMPGEGGGAMPSDPLAGLDPATAALVKKIANYDALPASLGRAPNRADLLGRAAMLNPDFNEANAKEAYTFKTDLGRSSATSAGGQVTSINTALHHLGTMLQANKALNDSGATSRFTMINKAKNAISHGSGNSAVNNWNQAKTYLSEEFAKLIKGGVASEGEIQAIQANLDASLSPQQRNDAIAQAAQFLQGRIDAIDKHRHDSLGEMAGDKSLMSPEAQRILQSTLRLRGNGGGAPAPSASGHVLRYNPATGKIE
jgi:hypothetical protein